MSEREREGASHNSELWEETAVKLTSDLQALELRERGDLKGVTK